jgi:hypothetical protein
MSQICLNSTISRYTGTNVRRTREKRKGLSAAIRERLR